MPSNQPKVCTPPKSTPPKAKQVLGFAQPTTPDRQTSPIKRAIKTAAFTSRKPQLTIDTKKSNDEYALDAVSSPESSSIYESDSSPGSEEDLIEEGLEEHFKIYKDSDPEIRELERVWLQAHFGPNVTSSRQIYAPESLGSPSSIYSHSNSDISPTTLKYGNYLASADSMISLSNPFAEDEEDDHTRSAELKNTTLSDGSLDPSTGFIDSAKIKDEGKAPEFNDDTVTETDDTVQVAESSETAINDYSQQDLVCITALPTEPNSPTSEYDDDDSDASYEMRIPRKSVGSGSSRAAPSDTSLDSPGDSVDGAHYPGSQPSVSTIDDDISEEEMRLRTLRHEALHAYKVEEFRLQTGTMVIDYDPNDPDQIKHPNHARDWSSKNLWCTNCQGRCALCGASCCALYAAWHCYNDQTATPVEKSESIWLIKEIHKWMHTGTDEPTFMGCTECRRLVCPGCCGICPVAMCHDRVCNECKSSPWEACAWHDML